MRNEIYKPKYPGINDTNLEVRNKIRNELVANAGDIAALAYIVQEMDFVPYGNIVITGEKAVDTILMNQSASSEPDMLRQVPTAYGIREKLIEINKKAREEKTKS